MQELVEEDQAEYKGIFRMSQPDFNFLLKLISPIIGKKDTLLREAVPSSVRLQVTLRYLATGMLTFQSSVTCIIHCVSKKTTVMLHTITSMHINRFW